MSKHTQLVLPLIYGNDERMVIPALTPFVATSDPDRPPYNRSTVTVKVIAIVRQPDGAEWVWWAGGGGYLKAVALVDGGLPVLLTPRKPKTFAQPGLCRHCGDPLPAARPARTKSCATCRKQATKLKRARRAERRARKRVCVVDGCSRRGCRKHYPTSSRRRAAYWNVPFEPIVSVAVYDRDGWLCGLCGLPVDKQLKWPDPMSVSLDHIVPMSKGGAHLWENVGCSHLTCNLRKHNKMLGHFGVSVGDIKDSSGRGRN